MEVAEQPDWQATVLRKRAERQSRLPLKWLVPEDELPSSEITDVTGLSEKKGWINQREADITSLDMVALAAAIKERQYSSVEVVEGFAHRATIAQQLVNALTEVKFERALVEAARLDSHLEQTGQVIGPLHGVPISVKDTWHVIGLDSTMGYCAWEGRIAKKDSLLVSALRAAGAIVIAKTNVGHTLMMGETVNHLWGRTVNPYNRTLTTGGSSGGEAALLALRGAAIGVGTDIGGSIRKPANMCGLWSLRPSAGRISLMDMSDSLVGQEAVKNAGGPMGHSARDLNLFMSAYMAYSPWKHDPVVLKMPWDGRLADPSEKSPLCFAIAWGDEQVTPHPPILRGLRHVVDALKKAGHMVVDWQGPIGVKETREIMLSFWAADGGEEIMSRANASGEPIYPEVANAMGMKNGVVCPASVHETWQNQTRRTKHAQWFHRVWQETARYSGTGLPIDGLISPTQPYVAAPHSIGIEKDEIPAAYDYAWLEPLLDLSSGTFPTGLCQDPSIDLPVKDFIPRSEIDTEVNTLYHDPQEWNNGPIGFQVTAQRLEEEKVVSMLIAIEAALAM